MYIKVTIREAAHILARGGMIWDGCNSWSCGTVLTSNLRGCKARKLRALERKLSGPWNVDGWYVYKRE